MSRFLPARRPERALLEAAPLALAAGTTLLCLLVAPAVVNGDGLGYLKAAGSGERYPGHLAWLPLLRGLRWLGHVGPRPIELLGPARALCAVSAGLAVLALGAAARLLLPYSGAARGPDAGVVAAAGLAASFGTLGAGCDVETYAPALAALCGCLWAIARRRTGGGTSFVVAAALLLAAATLLHVENVLFALPAALALSPARPERRPAGPKSKDGVWLLWGLSGGLVLGAYALAGAGPGWLLGASHGFRYPLHWYTPAIALYGACKALVYSPYPYEASWARVIGHFVAGALALATLAFVVLRSDEGTRLPLGRAATLAWALSYGAVGVAFFASDAERWIFLLPLGWLTVATARRHARLALATAGALLFLNLAFWLPVARNERWRDRARAAAARMRPGDLAISPGHGWDEYVGVYDGPEVDHFPLVYHVAQLGSAERVRARLAAAIDDARRRGRSIWLLRLDDASDPMGWKELAAFGVTPANALQLLPPGPVEPIGPGVLRFRPARRE